MRPGALAVWCGLVLSASACTQPSSVSLYDTPPAVSAPLVVTVTSDPPPRGDGTVPRNARFIVTLDDYPDPDAIGFGPITLRSGKGNFDLSFTVDLVGRSIVVTPRSLLGGAQQYDLVVSGLAALDDRVQRADVIATFIAGLDDGDAHPAPAVPTWCGENGGDAVQPRLATCAPFCHSTVGASGRTRTPTRLLDLTGDPRDPGYGLIGVTSVGLRGTPVPLTRVAPFDAARSVLLRKLLGGDPQANSADPPYPNLRVEGQRMPVSIDDDHALAPLDDDTLRLVQSWIAGGAPLGLIAADGSCPH